MKAQQPSALELRARVLDAIRCEPVPPRTVMTRRRAALLAVGFGFALVIALIKLLADHASRMPLPATGAGRLWHVVAAGSGAAQGRPMGYVLTLEFVWMLVATGATWFGVARGRSMLGRSTGSKIAVTALTPAALITTWLIVAFAWMPAVLPLAWLEAMDDGPDLQFHASCALMSVVYAAGPLVAFFAMRRRRDPVSAPQAGAAIGAVAGAWGAVVHFPFCQCTSPLHMALGHVLPVAILSLLGALAGDRVLGLPAKPASSLGGAL